MKVTDMKIYWSDGHITDVRTIANISTAGGLAIVRENSTIWMLIPWWRILRVDKKTDVNERAQWQSE